MHTNLIHFYLAMATLAEYLGGKIPPEQQGFWEQEAIAMVHGLGIEKDRHDTTVACNAKFHSMCDYMRDAYPSCPRCGVMDVCDVCGKPA